MRVWIACGCAMLAAGCALSVDYGTVDFACTAESECPDDQTCDLEDGTCKFPQGGDNPGDGDGDGDGDGGGGGGSSFMLSGARMPEVNIPDFPANGITDTITISEDCTLLELKLDINITHGWIGDLVIKLGTPSGMLIGLHNYNSAEDGGGGLAGTYPVDLAPVDAFDALYGETGTGDWALQIRDANSEDAGILQAWGVTLTCE